MESASKRFAVQGPRTTADYVAVLVGMCAVALGGLLVFRAIAPAVMPMMAAAAKQPNFCLWIPQDINDQLNGDGAVARCLQRSQSQQEFFRHCDLFPFNMRDKGGVNMSPYTSCIFGQVEQDNNPDACVNISDVNLRGQCVFPYRGTPAWQEVCMRARAEGWLGNATLIIDRCLTERDVNSFVQGAPPWFDTAILDVDTWGERTVGYKRDDTLAWLKSIGANFSLRNSTGDTLLMNLINLIPISAANGDESPLTVDDARAIIEVGVDPTISTANLEAVNLAFRYGNIPVLDYLRSLDSTFAPTTGDQQFFLEATCRFSAPSCWSPNDDLAKKYEAVRKEYIKRGWLPDFEYVWP